VGAGHGLWVISDKGDTNLFPCGKEDHVPYSPVATNHAVSSRFVS
jgi:hypothetical protein